MNPKLTTIDPESKPQATPPATTAIASTPTAIPPKRRRSVRRQVDLGLVTGPGPGLLLAHEDATALQTLRQSVQDELGAKNPIQLVVAEFATADAWRGLRAHQLLASSIDTEVFDQTEVVDRQYEEIDPTSRTALIYRDIGLARVLRQFERTASECHRSIRQIFPMRAGKSGG